MSKPAPPDTLLYDAPVGGWPVGSQGARAAIERVRLVINPHPRARKAWSTPKTVPDREKPTRDAGEMAT